MRNKLGPAFVAGVVATSLIGISGTSALAATSPPYKRACHTIRVRTHDGVHHRRVCAKPKQTAPAPQPSYTYPTAPVAYVPPAAPVATPAAAPPAYVDDHPVPDYTTPGDDYSTPVDHSYGDDHGDDCHGDDRGDDRGDDGRDDRDDGDRDGGSGRH